MTGCSEFLFIPWPVGDQFNELASLLGKAFGREGEGNLDKLA